MLTEYDKYKEEKMQDPVFRANYILAKEKLEIELMLDSIDEAISKKATSISLRRKINKLRKHLTTLSL